MATYRPNPAFRAALAQALQRASLAMAQEGASIVRRGMTRNPVGVPSMPGQAPSIQTGLLRNSITARPAPGLSAFVASSARYSRIMEQGGTITAKNVKYLPVPVNYSAKVLQRRAGTGGLRTAMPNARIVRSKRGNLLLIGDKPFKTQKGYKGAKRTFATDVPIFVLKPSVTILPRPYFVKPLLASVQRFKQVAQQSINKSLGRGSRVL